MIFDYFFRDFMKDLVKRVEFYQKWIDGTNNNKFWLKAFYLPQAFLTAIQLNYARALSEVSNPNLLTLNGRRKVQKGAALVNIVLGSQTDQSNLFSPKIGYFLFDRSATLKIPNSSWGYLFFTWKLYKQLWDYMTAYKNRIFQ